jgi:hypothetical protein
LLTKEPLFRNPIDEKAEKYLWVDAATSSSTLGAVLAQKTYGTLDLDDPIHRYIFDKELPNESVRLYTSLPIALPKPSALEKNSTQHFTSRRTIRIYRRKLARFILLVNNLNFGILRM